MFIQLRRPTASAICPLCFRLADTSYWETRARHLVRPAEVADLVRFAPPGVVLHGRTWAEEVTRWLYEELTSRRLRYQAERRRDDWKHPARTRRDGGGDCEDLAILTDSMLWQGGLAPQLVLGHIRQNGACEGHAWVEGEDQRGFFLIEATSGSFFRDRPSQYAPLLHVQFGDPEQLPWRIEARLAQQRAMQRLVGFRF